jgi:hypothetical protein
MTSFGLISGFIAEFFFFCWQNFLIRKLDIQMAQEMRVIFLCSEIFGLGSWCICFFNSKIYKTAKFIEIP